jgi:hypothetical protein
VTHEGRGGEWRSQETQASVTIPAPASSSYLLVWHFGHQHPPHVRSLRLYVDRRPLPAWLARAAVDPQSFRRIAGSRGSSQSGACRHRRQLADALRKRRAVAIRSALGIRRLQAGETGSHRTRTAPPTCRRFPRRHDRWFSSTSAMVSDARARRRKVLRRSRHPASGPSRRSSSCRRSRPVMTPRRILNLIFSNRGPDDDAHVPPRAFQGSPGR